MRTTRTMLGALALGVAAGLAVPSGPVVAADHPHDHGHVAPAYALELLAPTDSGVSSGALGINDQGDVVGITRPSTTAQPQFTVLWERHGDHFHAHQLANLDGSSFSRGFDLNDSRAIVGEAFDSGGSSVPIRWSGDSAPTHVDTLSENGRGILNDVNDTGDAVGTAASRAVLLTADGDVETLPAPDGGEGVTVSSYSAAAIAANGDVAGRASLQVPHDDHFHSELRPVVWRDGTPELLTVPTDASSPSVAGITDDGDVVGSVTVGGKETAVTWDSSGSAELLTAPTVADYTHTAAKTGREGVFVGYVSKFAGNTSFGGAAVAWDAHGPVDLNDRVDLPEGVSLQSANDINEAGQIVGTATTASGARGFVLTPVVDEPGEPVATTVTATPVTQVYGRPAQAVVTVSPDATGSIALRVGSATVTGTLSSGRAIVILPAKALAPGSRSVAISYPGVDGAFRPAGGTLAVNVLKASPELRVKPRKAKVKRGKAAVVVVTVTAQGVQPTGKVRVLVAGKKRTVALDGGRAKVKVKIPRGTKRGAKKVTVSYAGDAFVGSGSATGRIKVTR